MTRADVTVLEGSELTHKAYLGSDAYPDGDYAMGLFKAFKKGTEAVEKYIDSLRNEYCDPTESDKIYRTWYRKPSREEGLAIGWTYPTKKNVPYDTYERYDGTTFTDKVLFEEYGYEYDTKKKTITMYYFGDKLYTITKSNVDRFMTIFENGYYNRIEDASAFDSGKMVYDYDRIKAGKIIQHIADSTEPVLSLVNNYEVSSGYKECKDNGMWYIGSGKIPDRLWGSKDYMRVLRAMKRQISIPLLLHRTKHKFDAYIQCPDCRRCLIKGISERTFDMLLADLCRFHGDELRKLAELDESNASEAGKIVSALGCNVRRDMNL